MYYIDDYGRDILFAEVPVWSVEFLVSRLKFLRLRVCMQRSLAYAQGGS